MPPELDFTKILANDTPQELTPPGGTPANDEGNLPPGETGALTDEAGNTVVPPGEEPPAPAVPPKGFIPEVRLKSETAKRREAERENRELREIIAKNSAPAPNGELKPDQFPTIEAYTEAVKEQAKREAKVEAANETASRHKDSFFDKLAKDGKDIEGFEDTLQGLSDDENYMPVSDAMGGYLMNAADNAAQLVKWLDDNRPEALRIYNLPPAAAIKELVRRDALLGRKGAPPVSRAPAPTPSVTGSGSAPQSIERMSHEDIKAWAREQRRK